MQIYQEKKTVKNIFLSRLTHNQLIVSIARARDVPDIPHALALRELVSTAATNEEGEKNLPARRSIINHSRCSTVHVFLLGASACCVSRF